MKKTLAEQRHKGTVLFLMLLFIVATSVGIGSLLYLVTEHCKQAKIEIESIKAFYLAETAVQRGIYRVKAETPKETSGEEEFTFEVGGEDLTLFYRVIEDETSDKLYYVTGRATFGEGERTLQADVVVNPPWEGFDYDLFSCSSIFNYAPIEYRGDLRTNGACRFYESTTDVYGDVYASQFIDGECDEHGNRYQGVPTIPLVPIDLNYYESLAIDEGGTVTHGAATLINNTFTGNVYLTGDKFTPLVFNGPVVVRKQAGGQGGDVIIHGVIRGRGTLYAERNIYIPNDLEYDQTAPFPAPEITDEEACDTWVRQNRTRDLVVLVAKENIVFGDYTTADWLNWMDGVPGMAYTNLLAKGEEDRGANFIWDTEIGQGADEGEDDDIFGEPGGVDWPCNYEDLDRDETPDGLIRYNQEISTQVDFNAFTYSPGGSFSDIADNYTTVICDAVLYSPHMVCGLSGNVNANMTHHGGIACDEHLHWYTDGSNLYRAYLMYDPRVHSRYRWDPTDANYYIDSISLPVDEKVAIYRWEELTEEE